MRRYLIRLANEAAYSPKDLQRVAERIREILGSREHASHFRISSRALEFNLFSHDEEELARQSKMIEDSGHKIITLRILDTPPNQSGEGEALSEGVDLFNEERYWESHETLEQIWRSSKGPNRDALQGLILTAAALVHYQRDEQRICLSVLRRARTKLDAIASIDTLDLDALRKEIDEALASKQVHPFKLASAC